MTPHTRMDWVRLRAAQRRAPYANPGDTVQAMDQIRDLYPDPRTRPPGAAEWHDRLADNLKET